MSAAAFRRGGPLLGGTSGLSQDRQRLDHRQQQEVGGLHAAAGRAKRSKEIRESFQTQEG